MEQPSQLDRFLSDHRDDGEVVNEGSFTISREKALNKLANFKLPFSGAWAVKAVQAIVHGGQSKEIRISLTRSEARFGFMPPSQWSFDELERSFFDPEPGPDQSVNYLMACLWTVGVGQKRAFMLSLPQESEALIWDGTRIHRQSLEEPQRQAQLTISNKVAGSGWFGNTISNADITRAVSEYCYPCPVPLIMDGRRVDGLHFSPLHGWSKESFPLAISFPEADLPNWKMPPGTFEELVPPEMGEATGGGLKDVTVSALASTASRREAQIAALITAHAQEVVKGQKREVKPKNSSSRCYWVQDGAVVDQESYDVPAFPCSAGLYVSAEGLENDLSGFFLSRSEERTRRKNLAARALARDFEEYSRTSLQEIVAGAARRSKQAGIGFMVVGLGVTFLSPFHGIAAIAAGVMAYTQGGKYKSQWAKEYEGSLERLSQAWKRTFG